MARDRASIRIDMWADDGWRELTMGAQHLYMELLSHPTLTYCGVADWRPGKLAAATRGLTAGDIVAAGAELAESYFIGVDEETEEVLVRSYVKHDGLMKQPKLVVTMALAFANIASAKLRAGFAFEVQKLRDEEPELRWDVRQLGTVLDARAVSLKDSFTPRFTPTVTPTVTPSVTLNAGHRLGLHTATATATATKEHMQPSTAQDEQPAQDEQIEQVKPSTSPYSAAFEEWWKHYPRRQSKGDAFKAWEVTRKKKQLPDFAEMNAAADAYAKRMADSEQQFIKLPAGWLRDRKWEDDDATARQVSPEAATRSTERDRWLSDRGVTVAEYEARKNETGWLDSLKKLGK